MTTVVCPECKREFDHDGPIEPMGIFCLKCRREEQFSKMIKADKDRALAVVYREKPITPEMLEAAYKAGLVRESDFEHGVYYAGWCRNASIAVWDANNGCFWYIRSKFGDRFSESIKYAEADDGYDFFRPLFRAEPMDNERVRSEGF